MSILGRIASVGSWIKMHRSGSVVAAVTGAFVPVIDAFLDVWKILDKIRPIYGFPLWLAVALCVVGLAIVFALWFSGRPKCPAFWKKQSVKDWLKYALLGIMVLLFCALLSVIITSKVRDNKQKMFAECMRLEQKYLREGTHGLREFYEGNYGVAYDSLKLYRNADPVSACYYAEILYDGLWQGVEQHETTNAVRLLDSAASRQFYRAIYKMEDYYFRQKMEKEAMRYAEQYLLVSVKPTKAGDDTILREQTMRWIKLCAASYYRLFFYLVDNNHEVSELESVNKVFWSLLSNLQGERKANIEKYRADIRGARLLGKSSAQRKAKRLVKKFNYEPSIARLYVATLLDGQICDTCMIDEKKGAKAEEVLLNALRVTSERILVDSLATECEGEMLSLAIQLSDLYDKCGYGIESAEMDHLASVFKLKIVYEDYEKISRGEMSIIP